MSSASKSTSKDKKAGKEPVKAYLKPSGMPSLGSGIPASAYNPILGTFHSLEIVSSSPHVNGRFRNIDESDEHSGGECDAISNNGSWSGESEEHKDKLPSHPVRQEAIPGADLDKREKARQKNERKHQRQKEKRAQELHEKCCGFLMSRKLDSLTRKLVVMGFTSERATMALILNDGRVEESVVWLLERGEEDPDKSIDENQSAGSKMKIDVSEELAQIADMTIRFNCSKQEVERAVVTCEGDLDRAAETLKTQKQEHPDAIFKSAETGNLQLNGNGKLPSSCSQNPSDSQRKTTSPNPGIQRRDEKDFNYTKTPIHSLVSPDSRTKLMQPLRRPPPISQEIAVPSERRILNMGSNNVSYSSAPTLQIPNPPTKIEARYTAAGTELKNLQKPGSLKEPVTVMRRHQTMNGSQVPVASIASSLPSINPGWNHSSVDVRHNGLVQIPSPGNLKSEQVNLNQLHLHQLQYEQCRQSNPGNGLPDTQVMNGGNSLSNRVPTSPSISAASSLGLFSGTGLSNGSSGSDYLVDWKTGFMIPLDYNRIDWSLDRPAASPSAPEGALWSSLGKNSAPVYDANGSGIGSSPSMRMFSSSRSGIPFAGLQNGGMAAQAAPPTASSREWSSPFESKDLFSLPRQFVHSPSL